jgi:hypothetical protein
LHAWDAGETPRVEVHDASRVVARLRTANGGGCGLRMRPVVLQMGVTLDGYVHGAKGYEHWGLPPEAGVIGEFDRLPAS